MKFKLIVIRRGHHYIVSIIFCEVRTAMGRGIEILPETPRWGRASTFIAYGSETGSRLAPEFNYN